MGLNLIGNLIFWVPLFYASFNETNNIKNVNAMFYVSVDIVALCLILQFRFIQVNYLICDLIEY